VLTLCLILAGCAAPSHEPRNISLLKDEIRAYVADGRYERDIAVVATRADAWLVQRAARRGDGERLAVVLDLDETLLSNWPFIAAEDIGGSDAAWDAWLGKGEAPAIEPVRAVYRTARRLGIDVLFITSRGESLRAATEKNLRAIGCGGFAVLAMKPAVSKETAAAFKAGVRRRLSAEGRAIVANIGDQDSDLAGGFAERTFKLPDPFYFTP
jgi:acid phosphatase